MGDMLTCRTVFPISSEAHSATNPDEEAPFSNPIVVEVERPGQPISLERRA